MAWKQLNWEVVASCVIAIGREEQRKTKENGEEERKTKGFSGVKRTLPELHEMWHHHWQQESICPWLWGHLVPYVHLVMGLSYFTLLWFDFEGHSALIWDQEKASLIPMFCLRWCPSGCFSPLIVFMTWFLCAGTCGGKRWGTVLGPQLSPRLCLTSRVSSQQSLSLQCLLGCTSVRGAACVGSEWHRLCCWYSRLNFAASVVLFEHSSPSIVWG